MSDSISIEQPVTPTMSTIAVPICRAPSPVASAADLSIVIARDATALAALAPQWNEIAGEVPFVRWEWADSWWRHYRTRSSELWTVVVHDSCGEVTAIAPWFIERTTCGGRVIKFLGSGEVCSDYLTIPCRDGYQQAVAERLAAFLACEAESAWQLIDLDGVSGNDSVIHALADALAARGHMVHRRPLDSAWCVPLATDWQSYLSTVSKSRRNRTRAILRDLVDSGRATLRQASCESSLQEGFQILVDLHQKRRRSLAEPGCFRSTRFTEFHREITARLLESGRLRLIWAELDRHPIAVDYSMVGGDTVYYYQGGFDPRLADERPGWLMHASSLKWAIATGYRYYDFLRGDETYKASWGGVARPLVRVRIVGRQRSARARHATWCGSQAVKRWARRVFSKAPR